MNRPKIKFSSEMGKLKYHFLYRVLMNDEIKKDDNLTTLFFVIPEILGAYHFNQENPNHHLDVLEHTIYAISLAPKDFDLRLALLLHDIGKPGTFVKDSRGIGHFPKHPVLSEKIAREVLTNLEFNKEYIDYICKLVLNHDTLIKNNKTKIEEIVKKNGKQYFHDLITIQYADAKAHHPDKVGYRIVYLNKVMKTFREVTH